MLSSFDCYRFRFLFRGLCCSIALLSEAMMQVDLNIPRALSIFFFHSQATACAEVKMERL